MQYVHFSWMCCTSAFTTLLPSKSNICVLSKNEAPNNMSVESLNSSRDSGPRFSDRTLNNLGNHVQLQLDETFNRIYAQHRANNTGCDFLPALNLGNCPESVSSSLESFMSNKKGNVRSAAVTGHQSDDLIERNYRAIQTPVSPEPSNDPFDRTGKEKKGRSADRKPEHDPLTEANQHAIEMAFNRELPPNLLDDQEDPNKKLPENHAELPSMGEAVDRWDAQIVEAAEKWGVPAAQLKAMVWIETGGAGDPNAVQINPTFGNTYGLTQINPKYWADEAATLGYDLSTVEGQLGMGAYILRQGYETTGTWDGASSWYFNPSSTGDAVNGTTNSEYIARMHELMGY